MQEMTVISYLLYSTDCALSLLLLFVVDGDVVVVVVATAAKDTHTSAQRVIKLNTSLEN